MEIRYTVKSLINEHNTANPFAIAKGMGITIIRENLGSIKGYYNMPCGQRQIHVNSTLSIQDQVYTVAHELGHAILHQRTNTYFLLSQTFLRVDKYELEADAFASCLLTMDENFLNYLEDASN